MSRAVPDLSPAYPLVRELLFRLDPETAHDLALSSLARMASLHLSGLMAARVPEHPVQVMGIRFPNPVGLAAGLDKNGEYIDGLAALGFGFIEVGTVTPRAQPGNPKPRLFRLPEHQAIINRMGFNNHGVDYLVRKVEQAKFRGVLGINIGKNKDTPNERAVDDYLFCMERVYPLASYITVNLSSPNTPGLRDLQFGEPLKRLLSSLKERQQALATATGRKVPLLLKVAPDMTPEDIADVAASLLQFEVEGLIATNTTISRGPVAGHRYASEAGGLSGAPVRELSTATLRMFAEIVRGKVALVGVGGITDGSSAGEKVAAGANLLQLYSGFLYRGPSLIRESGDAFVERSPQ